jgi:hypothetical protein
VSTARPSSGDAQSPAVADEQPPTQALARIRAHLAAIEAEAATNGENSPGLIPLLESLADVYEEIGDYEGANGALEQAQHVVRVQRGLYSLDQAAIVEQMIENDIETEPGEEFSDLESFLSELVQRNPDDPRVVELLTNKAEREMDVVHDLLVNGVPPELDVNVGIGGRSWNRFAPPRTARYMARSMVSRARSSYGSAMQAALRRESLDIPRLLELEDSIIQTYYFELMNAGLRGRRQPYASVGRLYFGGTRALEAKIDNSRHYPGTPVAVTNAMLELADWRLMFYSFGLAMRSYEDAREYLVAQGASEAVVADVFSPEAPVPLPAFVPNASVYVDEANVHGFIDVSIEINRFGGVRDIDILGRSANASGPIARRLKRHVYQSRFRPRFVDGEWQRSDRFVLRYHFSYASS